MATCSDPHCDRVDLPQGMAIVADRETGDLYCDALCHHSHRWGVRPPITQAEADALDLAWEWMARHRPDRVRIGA